MDSTAWPNGYGQPNTNPVSEFVKGGEMEIGWFFT